MAGPLPKKKIDFYTTDMIYIELFNINIYNKLLFLYT